MYVKASEHRSDGLILYPCTSAIASITLSASCREGKQSPTASVHSFAALSVRGMNPKSSKSAGSSRLVSRLLISFSFVTISFYFQMQHRQLQRQSVQVWGVASDAPTFSSRGLPACCPRVCSFARYSLENFFGPGPSNLTLSPIFIFVKKNRIYNLQAL